MTSEKDKTCEKADTNAGIACTVIRSADDSIIKGKGYIKLN